MDFEHFRRISKGVRGDISPVTVLMIYRQQLSLLTMRSIRPSRCTLASAIRLCCVTAVINLPCEIGNAFVTSSAAWRATRFKANTPTTRPLHPLRSPVTKGCCRAEDVEDKTTVGEMAEVIEESFNDDCIHPSAAWLYQSSMSPIGKSTSSPPRRTLSVDYGTHRVGLAIGIGISPRMVPGITNRGNDLNLVRQILVRARGEGIRDIVVGLPLIRNGTETEMCEIVRSFASVLADAGGASRSPVSVYLWDERFSSAQAGALLDRHGGGMGGKVEIDSLAASLILDHYFAGGGRDRAEKVEPRMGTAEILYAAGRTGQEDEGETDEDDIFGESSRRRMYEERMESIRSAANEEFVPMMPIRKSKRKRRKRT